MAWVTLVLVMSKLDILLIFGIRWQRAKSFPLYWAYYLFLWNGSGTGENLLCLRVALSRMILLSACPLWSCHYPEIKFHPDILRNITFDVNLYSWRINPLRSHIVINLASSVTKFRSWVNNHPSPGHKEFGSYRFGLSIKSKLGPTS